MAYRVLIVDDEREIAELVGHYLENEGYQVRIFHDGQEALRGVEEEEPDLAILDVMLPGMDGFTLCQRIRERHLFPIIMLTARVDGVDKIAGLALGADDYITKPFNPLELVARVKTQLRRYTRYNAGAGPEAVPREFDIAGLYVCRDSHKCTLYGREVPLTPLEFGILWYLAERRGRVVSSEELFEGVWGEKYLDNNNTVMTHIARLREKLGDVPRKPRFIKTVWGVGYTIE